MAIFSYQKDGTTPSGISSDANMAFSFIRSQLDRDGEKYADRCRKNSINGAKGGRPKKSEKTDGFYEKASESLNDNDTDSDTVVETDTETDTHTGTETDTAGGVGEDGVGESDFNQFWDRYPKHVAKSEARTAFFGTVHSADELSELLLLVDKWKNSKEWKKEQGKWIKRADRFLYDIFPDREVPPSYAEDSLWDEFFEAALKRSYDLIHGNGEEKDGPQESEPPDYSLYSP